MKANDFIFDSSGDLEFQADLEDIKRRIMKKLAIPPGDLTPAIELPVGNQTMIAGARAVLKIDGKPVAMFGPVMENIRAWDSTDCKHENVQEVLLLNFTVKHCKDCGREVK